MAFPTGYSKYQEVTIDSSKVTADQTDFPIYIDLSEMDKATDIFDSCRSDGGDIRVTKADGTTQLPREVVAIDTTAKTGELHLKYTGTLSSSSNTVIRIYYNGADTEPAANSTYGSENVWDDNYMCVLHMGEVVNNNANGYPDSTANANHATGYNMDEAAVNSPVGNAQSFNAAGNDYLKIPYSVDFNHEIYSLGFWIRVNAKSAYDTMAMIRNGRAGLAQFSSTGNNFKLFGVQDGASFTLNQWYFLCGSRTSSGNASRFLKNGLLVGTSTLGFSAGTEDGNLMKYYGVDTTYNVDGQMGEFRHSKILRADTWIATEHNNQNSPSTFYSVGEEQGGGATPVKIEKSLKYCVETTPSAKTKSLKYTVVSTPSAVTKSLSYKVVASQTIQKSLKYTIESIAVVIQKSLEYTVTTTVSAITKSLQYVIDSSYTREANSSLPADSADLSVIFNSSDRSDVATDDGVRVATESTGAKYLIHQFQKRHSNNTDDIKAMWNGQVSTACSIKTVYLQVYNHTSGLWETLDSDTTAAKNTDFDLEGVVSASHSNYYHGASNEVSFRVYQTA